jgi:phosphoribosylamine--glycine ligase
VDKAFGDAGNQVVIESFMVGEEVSYFAICDGRDFVAFPSAQDHKPVGDLDRGPNTGGMGAYCPAPVLTPELEERVIAEVVRPTLEGMAAEGNPYQGVLYVGLMIEDGAPMVVEYNCRFGDPECQPLMMMLESDLLDLLEAAVEGPVEGTVESAVARAAPVWRQGTAVCIVMASGGYPGGYEKDFPIHGLETATGDTTENTTGHITVGNSQCRVFHAGTARKDGRWVNRGGRVLGITAWGEDLPRALRAGYGAVENIGWEGAIYRKDIGLKGLKHSGEDRPAVNVGIVLGSISDKDVADKTTAVLDKLGIGYELAVASAHRTPERVRRFIGSCEQAGAEVFIAIAGMAAALPGVVAAETLRPVIGVPVKSSAFEGLDALLSIVQMPPGIPVATVAVGGGVNAALLAAHMLGLKYPGVEAALREYRLEQGLKVEDAHRGAGLSSLV